MSPSVMQLACKSEEPNLGMFSPQQAPSKQHCPPRVTQSGSIFPPLPDPGSAQAIRTLRIWICHIGWPFPGQREGKRCPGRGLGVSTPWRDALDAAGRPPISLVPYLGCSPWLRTVGRKKRDLREEKCHTESEQSKRTACRRSPGEESLPPPGSAKDQTSQIVTGNACVGGPESTMMPAAAVTRTISPSWLSCPCWQCPSWTRLPSLPSLIPSLSQLGFM